MLPVECKMYEIYIYIFGQWLYAAAACEWCVFWHTEGVAGSSASLPPWSYRWCSGTSSRSSLGMSSSCSTCDCSVTTVSSFPSFTTVFLWTCFTMWILQTHKWSTRLENLTLILLAADLANTKWSKKQKNDWNPGKWVLVWEYSVRAIQWIPTWQG